MRILHITTIRSGSTGRTASDLKAFFRQEGEEYIIAYSVPDDKPIDGDILIGNKVDHKIHALLSRVSGLQGYFSFIATMKFLRKVKFFKPDIVQLGNLHANFINLPLLFQFLSKENIPVVMILHDCWFFTGKCTHFTARKCYKWKLQCHHCPALKSDNESWFFDQSRKMFRDRLKWYSSLKSLSVIAVSDWEKHLAAQSPLFRYATISRIYNWINTDVFKPASKSQQAAVIAKYYLQSDIRYVISVGAGWAANSSKTIDAISFANHLPDGYRLIVVGGSEELVFPKGILHIPYISNVSELAALYSLSSAYIHFSVEDTFGKVIAEAMACATVPIVFNSTACSETAGPQGISVSPHNVVAMIGAIPAAEEKIRRESVRKYALENYYQFENMELYKKKYLSILLNR